MTDQEKYVAGQKECGIEVGDEVRATRHFVEDEGGSNLFGSDMGAKAELVGGKATGTVAHIFNSGIQIKWDGDYWEFPYFVLEIVKKANGNVPDAKPITKGDSKMTNTKYDCEVQVETKRTDGKVVANETIVPRYELFASSPEKAEQRVRMEHGPTIIKAEDAGAEVAIICKPFCRK